MPRFVPRPVLVTLALTVLVASILAQNSVDPFYEKLVTSGKEAFESKDFENAVKSFEVAFIGFVDNPSRLLECYVYLAVSYGELGDSEKSDYYLREIRRRKLDKHLDAANLPDALLEKCGLFRIKPVEPSPSDNGATPASTNIKVGDLIPIEEADSIPTVLTSVEPVYPLSALRLKTEGTVALFALISEKGDVLQVKPAPGSSTRKEFNQAAERALRRWKFKPATKNGVQVKVWKKVAIDFKLKNSDKSPAPARSDSGQMLGIF